MHDVLIIGGGVIGLSLAWELAKHGRSVHVIDQGEPGREASWAGAGILPAASAAASEHPSEQLRGLAYELHPRWAAELQAATGIDTGYRRCGGLHLARTPGEAAATVPGCMPEPSCSGASGRSIGTPTRPTACLEFASNWLKRACAPAVGMWPR